MVTLNGMEWYDINRRLLSLLYFIKVHSFGTMLGLALPYF